MLSFVIVPMLYRLAAAKRPAGTGDCYFIDGSRDNGAKPCYQLSTLGSSMCCTQDEECRSDGLCLSTPVGEAVGPYDKGKAIWRRSCSDFTWQDAACQAIPPS